ncbi:TIR domain-containing protein [Streptomyces pluripotens]|uniref:TIR domain-containing protein n=1 Tax=Streptomyces pluripotens TaxID=1355015 RepID=A0A221NYA5_9ACTN|nr:MULTISPECIES: toll/interleukin-1 receptor domain-containing protein [Streptomyces]ARP70624.1 TIR domain-containing protein [Streptomyces pluripotens]ASN24884.1 TIR domain-containing protein [Streptomyces pluripotens]MCH0556688.1 toll/interleukin-1 receptor domain-containing protein [Streptomyces sp. MUM 16J]
MAPLIFVNFRRRDTRETGPHIDTALQREFGAHNVFRDQRSIAKSADFREEIERKLRKCDILLAVIGHRWASVTDDAGRRLIDDEEDWVHQEIARAFEWKLSVLPVLVDGADLPDKNALPGDIAELANRQAVHFRPHQEHIDFPPLFEAIREAVPDLRTARRGDTDDPDRRNGGTTVRFDRIDRIDRASMAFGGSNNRLTTNNYASEPEEDD